MPIDIDSGPAPDPPVGVAITGITLGDGWTDPRALAAPINTEGWEDSSYISASGRRLYFGYSRLDYDSLSNGAFALSGPTRMGSTRDAFEIYEATIQSGAWDVLHSTVNYAGPQSEAAEGVDDTESVMPLVRFDGSANQGDVYISKKVGGVWGVATKLPAPINTSCVEDNAAISGDGQRLYFDSNRVDAKGTTCKATSGSETRDIYVSTLTNGAWSDPVLVTGEPAMGVIHWQVYPRKDQTELYWSGYDSMCGNSSCIYRATKKADGSYGDRVVVMKAVPQDQAKPGDAYGLGEVSITQDGRYMYFTYILRESVDGGFDGGPHDNLSIGVARKP
jgi:hypothetical protein